MWLKRAPQFLQYVGMVFGLFTFLEQYKDFRKEPEIPAGILLWILLLGIWGRVGSLNQLEEMGKDGELDEAVSFPRKPSADTLGRGLALGDAKAAWAYNYDITRKARRNKAFPGGGTINGLMVAAIDGTEYYNTERPSRVARDGWSQRSKTVHRQKENVTVTEYYERGVAISYVGVQPRLQLGEERIQPGSGEQTTALRLIDELDRFHGWHWCDLLTTDSGFVSGPFINAVRARHKHVLVKVKQEKMLIVKEANAEFSGREPSIVLRDATCLTPEERDANEVNGRPRYRYQVRIWDGEGFCMWSQVGTTEATSHRGSPTGMSHGTWHDEAPQTYYIATTMPRAILPSETVWLIMHRRWDIENSLFNDLKQNWGLRHCYTQDPNGIRMLMALVAIARNLMLLFAYRRLRRQDQRRTLTALIRQVVRGILIGLGPNGRRTRWRRTRPAYLDSG